VLGESGETGSEECTEAQTCGIFCDSAYSPIRLAGWLAGSQRGRPQLAAVLSSKPYCGAIRQLEIILNFFIGYYDAGCYEDSLFAIAKRNLSDPSLFWFDAMTSIPLSYIDLYFSKVSFNAPSSKCWIDSQYVNTGFVLARISHQDTSLICTYDFAPCPHLRPPHVRSALRPRP
jgi:hypothetical protein